MSYEQNKVAFDKTAARLRAAARSKNGEQLTAAQARDELRKILKRKNNL